MGISEPPQKSGRPRNAILLPECFQNVIALPNQRQTNSEDIEPVRSSCFVVRGIRSESNIPQVALNASKARVDVVDGCLHRVEPSAKSVCHGVDLCLETVDGCDDLTTL
jgi:hypothetical protein